MTGGWEITPTSADEPVEVVIGIRWGAAWRLAAAPWVPLAFARMLLPQPGLLRSRVAVRAQGPVVVQRWRSRGALDAWARDGGRVHAPAWARFRRQAGATAAWGVWHEVVPARRR